MEFNDATVIKGFAHPDPTSEVYQWEKVLVRTSDRTFLADGRGEKMASFLWERPPVRRSVQTTPKCAMRDELER